MVSVSMEDAGRLLAVAALALLAGAIATTDDARAQASPLTGEPSILVEVRNEAWDTELELSVEGPETLERTLAVPAGEVTRFQQELAPGSYHAQLADPSPVITTIATEQANLSACPGPWLLNASIVQTGTLVSHEGGCLAIPHHMQALLDRARQATSQSSSASISVPAPGETDEGTYAEWTNLSAPRPEEGTRLAFRWTPQATFPDAWGRPTDGTEVRYATGLPPEASAEDELWAAEDVVPQLARFPGRTSPPLAYSQADWTRQTTLEDETRELTVGWQIRYDGAPGLPACLLGSPIQGGTISAGTPLDSAEVCPGLASRPLTLHAGAPVEERGYTALPLYNVTREGERVTVHRMLWTEDLAYPLQAQRFAAGGGQPAEHEAYTLLGLEETPPAEASSPPDPALELPLEPLDPLDGPHAGEAARQRLAFTLAEASQAARNDPRLTQLQALLADDAVLAAAALGEQAAAEADGAAQLRWWLLYAVPEGQALGVVCERPAPTNGTVTSMGLPRPALAAATCQEDVQRPPFAHEMPEASQLQAGTLPAEAATFDQAIERWETLHGDRVEGETVTSALYQAWPSSDEPARLGVGTTHQASPTPPLADVEENRTGVALALADARTVSQRFVTDLRAGWLGTVPALATPGPQPPEGFDPPTGLALVAGAGTALGLGALLAYLWSTGALTSLYTRLTREEVLEHPTRQAVRSLLQEQPGLHANAIAEQVDANPHTASYHLERLVDEDVLTTLERGGYTHYFVAGHHDREEQQALAALRRGNARRAYEAIRERPGLSLSELAERIGTSPSYASKTVDHLVEVGLVAKTREGRRVELHAEPAPTDRA